WDEGVVRRKETFSAPKNARALRSRDVLPRQGSHFFILGKLWALRVKIKVPDDGLGERRKDRPPVGQLGSGNGEAGCGKRDDLGKGRRSMLPTADEPPQRLPRKGARPQVDVFHFSSGAREHPGFRFERSRELEKHLPVRGKGLRLHEGDLVPE